MITQPQIDKMVELRQEGQTLQQIGDRYGVTRERIRQLLAQEGVTGTPWTGYKAAHYARMAKAVAIIARLTVQTAKPGDEHFPHGTVRGYMRGCGCDDCRTANRERVYAYKGIQVKNPKHALRVQRTDGSRRAAAYYGETERQS